MKTVKLFGIAAVSILILGACGSDTDELAPDQDTDPPIATIIV